MEFVVSTPVFDLAIGHAVASPFSSLVAEQHTVPVYHALEKLRQFENCDEKRYFALEIVGVPLFYQC